MEAERAGKRLEKKQGNTRQNEASENRWKKEQKP